MNDQNKMSGVCESKASTKGRQSPRKAMAQAQITLSNPSLLLYQNVLKEAKVKMDNQHSEIVLAQLREASTRNRDLQKNLSHFRDGSDQFSDLQRLGNSGDIASDFDRSVENELPNPSEKAVPQFKDYTRITQSFLVEDNHRLPYEPYINDKEANTEANWRKKLHDVYRELPDPTSTYRNEIASHFGDLIRQALEETGLDIEQIKSDIATHGKSNTAYNTSELPGVVFTVIFQEIFGVALGDIMPETGEKDKTRNDPKGSQKYKVFENMLATHWTACPLCGVHGCGAHGDYESSDDEETFENTKYCDLNMPFDSMMQRQHEKSERSKVPTTDSYINKDERCSATCFLSRNDGNRTKSQDEWSPEDIDYLKCLIIGIENERRVSCTLAPLVGRSCTAVYDRIHLNRSIIESLPRKPHRFDSNPPKLDWYDNKMKIIRTGMDWRSKTNTHSHEKRKQPFGCDHKGRTCHEAKDQCHCFLENTLCDKFCSCSDDCHLRFTGCNCSQTGSPCPSNSKTCVCRLLNRECDPDLCQNCGARESANPFTRHEKTPNFGCSNTVIQRGLGVKLLIGESQVSGFGAFLGELVRRDQYIGEYVGEIISSLEADRRSVIYNKFKISYFFTLNESKVIDGYRFGNTTRFINHGQKNENCYVKVKLVNGEHRIAFFAQRDLPAGTELFFDYGEEFLRTHKLNEIKLPGDRKERMEKGKGQISYARVDTAEVTTEKELQEEEEEEALREHELIDLTLADIPEYDTDDYEEGERRERSPRGVRRDRDSEDRQRQRQRPRRRAARKPIKYTR